MEGQKALSISRSTVLSQPAFSIISHGILDSRCYNDKRRVGSLQAASQVLDRNSDLQMSTKAKSIRSTIALLIVIACAGLAHAGDDKQPSVKLKGIALKSFTLSNQTAETTVSIEIDNPGPEFKIKDASYCLKLNQRQAAEGKRDEEITVPAAGSITVDLPVTVNLAELPGVTWSTIIDGLTVNYELETEFTVPVFALFNHTVKTSFKGDLPLGQMILSLPGILKERWFGKP